MNSSIQIDEDYLKQLILCFAINGTCTLFEQELGLETDILTKNLRRFSKMNWFVEGKPYPTATGTFSVFIVIIWVNK